MSSEQSSLSSCAIELVLVAPELPLRDAMAQLDRAGTGALALVRSDRTLVAVLTDGDIRRAVLRGDPLSSPCLTVATQTPHAALAPVTTEAALRQMVARDINHLPVVDEAGRLVDFLLRRDLGVASSSTMSAVIMAGGFGKRLRPLTESLPKPMLPIGDRPLLERTIMQLRDVGIRDISLTTHYLPEKIVDHFGTGAKHGVDISYVRETHPLGTAGGLRQAPTQGKHILVMNGDILTGVPVPKLRDFHQHHDADLTVGVRRFEVEVPYGVVEGDGVQVTSLREKPTLTFFINAGTYLLNADVVRQIPADRPFDMTDLIQLLIDQNRRVISFPIWEYWLDIGRPEDYVRAQEDAFNGKI